MKSLNIMLAIFTFFVLLCQNAYGVNLIFTSELDDEESSLEGGELKLFKDRLNHCFITSTYYGETGKSLYVYNFKKGNKLSSGMYKEFRFKDGYISKDERNIYMLINKKELNINHNEVRNDFTNLIKKIPKSIIIKNCNN